MSVPSPPPLLLLLLPLLLLLLLQTMAARATRACESGARVPHLLTYVGSNRVHRRASDAEWIDTYSDPGFGELATTLEALLDRYAGRLEGGYEKRMDEIRQLYVRAMELELAFFSAWDPKQKVEL